MASADQAVYQAGRAPERNGVAAAAPRRVRVDGKFFARGGRRLRAQGVTYGPSAPNRAGEPFPPPEVVADDLARMAACGLNSLRENHRSKCKNSQQENDQYQTSFCKPVHVYVPPFN